jgi:D-threo-aldose 1-dehydrogenase
MSSREVAPASPAPSCDAPMGSGGTGAARQGAATAADGSEAFPRSIAGRLGPLGLGAANLGNLFHAMTDEQAVAILEAAWQGGIRYFDTAPHYGLGLSERRLGAFLATKPRSEFVLSTKVGRRLVSSQATAHLLDDANDFMVPAVTKREWDFSADGIRRGLEESLERLSLDSVDVLYLHDPEEYDLDAALRTGLPALAALRDEGMVTAIGVGSKQIRPLLAAVRTEPIDLVMVAGRYTLLEQPAREELIPECRRRGVGVVAAAVFNSGLLATSGPAAGARYEYRPAPAEILARVGRIEQICREFRVELPAAALQYPLREESVCTVVVGAAAAGQVGENLRRLRSAIPDGLWQRLAAEGLVPR